MKNILIIPDSFKGCLSAPEVATAIKGGVLAGFRNHPQLKKELSIKILPLSDGGEGALPIVNQVLKLPLLKRKVFSPLEFKKDNYKKHLVRFAFSKKKKIAFIESAKICGLELLQESEKNPFFTHTYPLGELLDKILKSKEGVREILISLGGSATNDGGVGMLQALGAEFFFKKNYTPAKILTVRDIPFLKKVELKKVFEKFKKIKLTILSDVKNELLGKEGATFVYGPQKGRNLSKTDLEILEKNLKYWAHLIGHTYPRFKKFHQLKGSGAAGGLGYAFSLLGGELVPGFTKIASWFNLTEHIKRSDLVFTGEGGFDKQSLMGKIVGEIIRQTTSLKIPLIIVAGKSNFSRKDRDNFFKKNIELILLRDEPFKKNSQPEIFNKEESNFKIRKKVQEMLKKKIANYHH